MGENERNLPATVVIDEEGVLARWADWQGRSKQLSVAAIGNESERPMMFVSNEVLVDAEDRELVDQVVGMGATVVPEEPLLPAPHGMDRRELTGEFPMPVRLQFAEPPNVRRPAETLTELFRANDARGRVTVTSDGAARVATLVARFVAEGRQIGLNSIGQTEALPLKEAKEASFEGEGDTAFGWPAFSGKSRIVNAWQLFESARAVGSVKPVVFIAIMDGGFWLDAAGKPMVAAGQTVSDFGSGVLQVNLIDEKANASGENPNKCSGDSSCPWHGNGVASAALATVGNGAGAAGSGGIIAQPVFFRTSISESQVYRCLQYCVAWGLDVLNMSFSMKRSEFFFATGTWDKAFNFAVANGLVMVCASGNDGEELPDYNVRPATRTPGVITVGALDTNDAERASSNYGSSISIWAPGTNIQIAPAGEITKNNRATGTSQASPIVAGVAAMIKAINPSLNSVAVRQIINETGWQGAGRVSRGLDAYAAVLKALGGKLPSDLAEPNNTPATAGELYPTGPGGTLRPLGGVSGHSGGDTDFYKLQLKNYSTIEIRLEWYQLIASLSSFVESDDPENQAPAEMMRIAAAPGVALLRGLLPPGNYRIRISGSGDTAYELNVTKSLTGLPKDQFEPNDSFEKATKMLFEAPKGEFGGFIAAREWGPGIFKATLHEVYSYAHNAWIVNSDYYRFDVPESSVFRIPTVTIANTDLPIDVTLYDAAQQVIQTWAGVRKAEVVPPDRSTCYLKVSGATPNQYTIATSLKVDREAIPGPLQEELEILPKWWGDPEPFKVIGPERFFAVDLGRDRGDGTRIVFSQPEESVRVDLTDLEGNVIRQGTATQTRMQIDTSDVDAGQYLVRISRDAAAENVGRPLAVRLMPPR